MPRRAAEDDLTTAQSRERTVLRESFRYLEHAPLSIVVVHGAEHTVIYANAAFRDSSGLSDATILARPIADVLENHTPGQQRNPSRVDIIDLLDRVRDERVQQSDVNVSVKVSANISVNVSMQASVIAGVALSVADDAAQSVNAETGDQGIWRCKVWPVELRGAWIDQLIVELWHAREGESSRIRQRDIAERMLLSALRERALSDDNVRLYEAADLARGAAEQAQVRAEVAQREAESANASKGRFLASMSHELRTPLNAISGYAQLIELGLRGPVTEAQVEDLQRIQRSEAHLLSLINAVLNYAKLDAGKVVFDKQDVVLGDVVAGAESLVSPQLRKKRLHYTFAGCTDEASAPIVAPMRLVVDAEKLMQILVNLLTNAIKFTEPDGRITVACRTVDGRALISISDTGRGIPADKLQGIFEPFVQIGRTLSSADTGVGLGLAISRDLAVGMGGTLSAESVDGESSTFTLTLPLAG